MQFDPYLDAAAHVESSLTCLHLGVDMLRDFLFAWEVQHQNKRGVAMSNSSVSTVSLRNAKKKERMKNDECRRRMCL